MAGWFILPTMVTSMLQSFYYRLVTPVGEPKPAKNSMRYIRDYKRIYSLVIVSYLIFSIVESFYNVISDPLNPLSSNKSLYSILEFNGGDKASIKTADNGFAFSNKPIETITQSDLRSMFRKLSLKYHPDKAMHNFHSNGGDLYSQEKVATAGSFKKIIQAGNVLLGQNKKNEEKQQILTQEQKEQQFKNMIEAKYIAIKNAYEALSNDVVRYGYDRFGPSAIEWAGKGNEQNFKKNSNRASTYLEFMILGLRSSLMSFYIGVFCGLTLSYMFSYPKTGHVWRFYFTLIGIAIELFIVTRPIGMVYTYIPIMRWLNLLPYQMVSIIHKLIMTSFIAVNQLGGLVSEEPDEKSSSVYVDANGNKVSSGSVPSLNTKRGQKVLNEQLKLLEQVTDNITHESVQSYRHQLRPFLHDAEKVKQVQGTLVDTMVEIKIMDDIEVKEAVKEVTEKIQNGHGNSKTLNATSQNQTAINSETTSSFNPVSTSVLGPPARKRAGKRVSTGSSH